MIYLFGSGLDARGVRAANSIKDAPHDIVGSREVDYAAKTLQDYMITYSEDAWDGLDIVARYLAYERQRKLDAAKRADSNDRHDTSDSDHNLERFLVADEGWLSDNERVYPQPICEAMLDIFSPFAQQSCWQPDAFGAGLNWHDGLVAVGSLLKIPNEKGLPLKKHIPWLDVLTAIARFCMFRAGHGGFTMVRRPTPAG